MFRGIFGPGREQAADQVQGGLDLAASDAGDTATVRRIVARLESMPAAEARRAAATAYTLARAANADLDVSADEMALIEQELQANGLLDEPTAVLVAEMARLQAKTVGGTEDYVVTREFRELSTDAQRADVLRACFAVAAASGTISAEETGVLNAIAAELGIEPEAIAGIRAEFHERLSVVQEVRRIAAGG